MVKQRQGKIIDIASEYFLFGSGRVPSYCASKGALVQLTKSMAIELATVRYSGERNRPWMD
jgi:NAD(P)-dependent dehydrogenase (short-subunit alcohol dehydrogenase family)